MAHGLRSALRSREDQAGGGGGGQQSKGDLRNKRLHITIQTRDQETLGGWRTVTKGGPEPTGMLLGQPEAVWRRTSGPEGSCKGRTKSLGSLLKGIQGGWGRRSVLGSAEPRLACTRPPRPSPFPSVRGPQRGHSAAWKSVELKGAWSPTPLSKENTGTSFSPYDLYTSTCEHGVTMPQKHQCLRAGRHGRRRP